MNCKKKVKSLDFFGKPITLQFKKGEHYNTFIGGLTSILLSSLMTIYFV
jgi:hypothetical protein